MDSGAGGAVGVIDGIGFRHPENHLLDTIEGTSRRTASITDTMPALLLFRHE
jgi:hypothetical protein